MKLQTIEPPWAGLWTVGTPGQAPGGKGPFVRNWLVHTPGKLVIRGGLDQKPISLESITSDPKAIISNIWAFNDKLLIGFHSKQELGEGWVPPWRAPWVRPTEASDLAEGVSKLALVDLSEEKATEISGASNLAPGSNGERLEDYVYGYAYSDEESETVNGGLWPRTKLLRWDGTTTKPTAYTNAPQGGQAVKAHLARLWVLAGRDMTSAASFQKVPFKVTITPAGPSHTYISALDSVSGGLEQMEKWFPKGAEVKGGSLAAGTKVISYGSASSGSHFVWCEKLATEAQENAELESKVVNPPIEPNSLFWTQQGGPIADETKYWQDENSGLTNRIVVGEDDQNDYGVGLAVVNQALVIFKRNSIWALYGYSHTTFQVRNLTKERGCIDPSSICEVDGGVYFISQNGLEFFDGAQFTRVDESIANVVDRYASVYGQTHSGIEVFGRLTCDYIGRNYIMVSLIGQRLVENIEAGVGEVASARAGFGHFVGYCHGPTGNWAQFTSNALDGVGKPLFVDNRASEPFIFDGKNIAGIRNITSEHGQKLDWFGGDNKTIPAKFRTDRIEMDSPAYKVQFHRFLLDYVYSTDSETLTDGSKGRDGLKVKLVGTNGALVMAEQSLPDHNAPTEELFEVEGVRPAGKRFVFDDFNEGTDIHMVVEYREEDEFTPYRLEVYNGAVEYEQARQRRTE